MKEIEIDENVTFYDVQRIAGRNVIANVQYLYNEGEGWHLVSFDSYVVFAPSDFAIRGTDILWLNENYDDIKVTDREAGKIYSGLMKRSVYLDMLDVKDGTKERAYYCYIG